MLFVGMFVHSDSLSESKGFDQNEEFGSLFLKKQPHLQYIYANLCIQWALEMPFELIIPGGVSLTWVHLNKLVISAILLEWV